MKKKAQKEVIPQYYDTLDLPAYIWQMVHESQDLTWLLVDGKKPKVGPQTASALQTAWDKIYDEYLVEFGMSETFVDLKRKELSLARLKLRMIISGDRSLQTDIELEEIELSEMKKSMGNYRFDDSTIAIEMVMKFQINMHTTPTRKYYRYLKSIQ